MRQTGTSVCSLARARNSLRVGSTELAEAFTKTSVIPVSEPMLEDPDWMGNCSQAGLDWALRGA
jgi:hypothetical protein